MTFICVDGATTPPPVMRFLRRLHNACRFHKHGFQ